MVLAPAQTPKDIVMRMNGSLKTAMGDPEIRDKVTKMGFEVSETGIGSPEAASDYLKSQHAIWGKTIRDLGLEPQ